MDSVLPSRWLWEPIWPTAQSWENMTRLRRVFLIILVLLTLWVLPRPPKSIDSSLPPLYQSLPHVPVIGTRIDVPGYSRERFGSGWASTSGSCTTREQVLSSWEEVVFDPKSCRAITGGGLDYYSGQQVVVTDTEIDHIFPLAAAWDLGAASWDPATRERFANDPINLVAVSREENREKSDSLPATWLPSDQRARCWYSRRLAVVAASYRLALPKADRQAMKRSCLLVELPALLLD